MQNPSPWSRERGPLIDKYDPWLPLIIRARTNPTLATAEQVWQSQAPFAIYVHIPFCTERCSYCDFTTYVNRSYADMEQYVEALKREIELYSMLPYLQNRQVGALYFGGGTPTHIPNELLLSITDHLSRCFDFTSNYEFCMETNPGDIDPSKLQMLTEVGVNRLSIGVQSFNGPVLEAMNRSHTSEQAISAIRQSREAGLAVNIDLIYGYPEQGLGDWGRSLDWTVKLEVERLTCTSLTVWPKTAIYHQLVKGKTSRVGEGIERTMFDMVFEKMLAAGYEQSTVLSFISGPQHVWQLQRDVLALDQEMIGMGASAFSLTRDWAYVNMPYLKPYVQTLGEGHLPIVVAHPVDTRLKMALAVVQSFKLMQLDRRKFETRFGVNAQMVYGDALSRLEEAGMITCDDGFIHLTQEGMWHLGPSVREFYHPDDVQAWEQYIETQVSVVV